MKIPTAVTAWKIGSFVSTDSTFYHFSSPSPLLLLFSSPSPLLLLFYSSITSPLVFDLFFFLFVFPLLLFTNAMPFPLPPDHFSII